MTKTDLETCIDVYGKDIYSFCRYLTNNIQEADDLYQDTFLKAIERHRQIDYSNNPKSYLISIAFHIWKNRKRKYAWRKRIADIHSLSEDFAAEPADPSASSMEEHLVEQEEAAIVRQAVAHLTERYKIIILLYYMEELSVAQISAILKIPSGTVKSRLYQARKLLAKELEDVLDEKRH